MSRKDDLGLLGTGELMSARRSFFSRFYHSRQIVKNDPVLRGKQPDEEEYLVAMLVAARSDQLKQWPEIADMLSRAEQKDWDRKLVVVSEDGDPKNMEVKNFGSFRALYAELCEPWLGPWAELRETYAKYQNGEIDHDRAAKEIESRAQRAAERAQQIREIRADNPDWTQARIGEAVGVTQQAVSEVLTRETATIANPVVLTIAQRAQAEGKSPAWIKQRDYVAKHAPELAERIGKDLSVSAAYRQVRPPDCYKQLCKWWSAASEEQRTAFENHIADWRRNQ